MNPGKALRSTLHAPSPACSVLQKQRRMGVEPTRDRAERPPSRFEDGCQRLLASSSNLFRPPGKGPEPNSFFELLSRCSNRVAIDNTLNLEWLAGCLAVPLPAPALSGSRANTCPVLHLCCCDPAFPVQPWDAH